MATKTNIKAEEGSVSYKKNVVLSIVNLATQEINGIAGLSNDGVGAVTKLFDKNYHKGVSIEFVENSVYVDVFVNVLFGHQNGFTKSKTGATSGTYGYSFDYCISNYSDRVCELEKKSDT